MVFGHFYAHFSQAQYSHHSDKQENFMDLQLTWIDPKAYSLNSLLLF